MKKRDNLILGQKSYNLVPRLRAAPSPFVTIISVHVTSSPSIADVAIAPEVILLLICSVICVITEVLKVPVVMFEASIFWIKEPSMLLAIWFRVEVEHLGLIDDKENCHKYRVKY